MSWLLPQFEALGACIGVRTATLVGGVDIMAQSIALAKRPHVLVGTPGRVKDHLTNTKVCVVHFSRHGRGTDGHLTLPCGSAGFFAPAAAAPGA